MQGRYITKCNAVSITAILSSRCDEVARAQLSTGPPALTLPFGTPLVALATSPSRAEFLVLWMHLLAQSTAYISLTNLDAQIGRLRHRFEICCEIQSLLQICLYCIQDGGTVDGLNSLKFEATFEPHNLDGHKVYVVAFCGVKYDD